jgi:hypothetical protein
MRGGPHHGQNEKPGHDEVAVEAHRGAKTRRLHDGGAARVRERALPEEPTARLAREAAFSPLRTKDEHRRTLPAAFHSDRILRALLSGEVRALQRGLGDLPRENFGGRRRTIHIEFGSRERRLKRDALLVVQYLGLGGASSDCHRRGEHPTHERFRHWNSS